jgi:predicted transcriptional regulator with HTH domain
MENEERKMFGKGKKTGFEKVYRSLRRSRVRTEILMYLYLYYPKALHPVEIAKNTGIAPTNVLRGLIGTGRIDASHSLLNQGVVERMEHDDATHYRLSERGKSLVESMHA